MSPNLDRRITIQSATTTPDATGQPIKTWADLAADVPAEYLPLSGREQLEAGQHLATAVARFRIRYRSDLARAMRILFENNRWNIRHFEEDRRFDRRQYMIVTAELIAAL